MKVNCDGRGGTLKTDFTGAVLNSGSIFVFKANYHLMNQALFPVFSAKADN